MAAIDELTDLLAGLPNAASVTQAMKQRALDGARIPDSFGIWPGQDGYENTYDIYFAAFSLIGFLKAQPVVTATSSEGTSVTVQAPDWGALVAYYRSMSPIMQATQQDVLREVPIPGGPHVRPTNMHSTDASGRTVPYYGDVDTDLG